jgi:hypothetical protein
VNLKFTVIMDDLETIEGWRGGAGVGEPTGMGVVFVTLTAHSNDLILKLITRRRSPRRTPSPVWAPNRRRRRRRRDPPRCRAGRRRSRPTR